VIRLRGTNCPYQQWFRIRHLAALDSSAQEKTVGMNAATNEAVAEKLYTCSRAAITSATCTYPYGFANRSGAETIDLPEPA
jgi:hypothetical protein